MKRLIITLLLMLFLIPSPIWAGSANDYPDNTGIVTAEDSLIGLDDKDQDPGWSMEQFTFATILTWIQNNIYPNAALTGDPTITDASPSLTFQDSNDAAGEASLRAISSGGTNAITWVLYVEEDDGSITAYLTLDGVNERIEFHKPLYGLGAWQGDFQVEGATSTIIYADTDGLGSDEEASESLANMTTVTDGAEVSDRRETFMNAGTRNTYSLWDGSVFTFTIGVLTDDWTGGDVATYESLKWDFDTGNDAEVVLTSPSGATKLDIQIATVEVDALIVDSIKFDCEDLANSTYQGESYILDCGDTDNCAIGDIVFIDPSDGDPLKEANATTGSGEFPAFGIVVVAGNDASPATVMTKGCYRDDSGYEWTATAPTDWIYLGEADGTSTQVAPSTSGDCVQIIGRPVSADVAFYDFSRPYSEVE